MFCFPSQQSKRLDLNLEISNCWVQSQNVAEWEKLPQSPSCSPPLSAPLQGVLHCMDTVDSPTHMYKSHPHWLLTAVPWPPFTPGMYMMWCVPPLGGWTQVRGLHWPWRQHCAHLGRNFEDPTCLEWEEQVQNVGSKFPWPWSLHSIGGGRREGVTKEIQNWAQGKAPLAQV